MGKNKKSLTHKEVSSRGGTTTLRRYGRDHLRKIGKKGFETVLKKYGPDHYKKIAKKSVEARRKKKEKKAPLDSMNDIIMGVQNSS